jgi:hypothetical protein
LSGEGEPPQYWSKGLKPRSLANGVFFRFKHGGIFDNLPLPGFVKKSRCFPLGALINVNNQDGIGRPSYILNPFNFHRVADSARADITVRRAALLCAAESLDHAAATSPPGNLQPRRDREYAMVI